jgi:hemolysin III
MTPRWRGALHMYALLALIPMAIAFGIWAQSGRHRLAALSYILGLTAMFATSALYHRGKWSTSTKARLQRFDHSTIFLAISGTYTAVALLVLRGWQFNLLLGIVWGGTALGIALQWRKAPPSRVISTAIYAIVGWAALPVLPSLFRGLSAGAFWLVVLGGIAYTIGAVVYAVKRPNPFPATFGFHEVFHAFTLLGAGCHFASLALTMTR